MPSTPLLAGDAGTAQRNATVGGFRGYARALSAARTTAPHPTSQ
ncbi:hypothetical protein ACQPYA_09620 [Micromonospora sp. CA-263727]